jgi:hypothetical protein
MPLADRIRALVAAQNFMQTETQPDDLAAILRY